jgi:hypothetical protein
MSETTEMFDAMQPDGPHENLFSVAMVRSRQMAKQSQLDKVLSGLEAKKAEIQRSIDLIKAESASATVRTARTRKATLKAVAGAERGA